MHKNKKLKKYMGVVLFVLLLGCVEKEKPVPKKKVPSKKTTKPTTKKEIPKKPETAAADITNPSKIEEAIFTASLGEDCIGCIYLHQEHNKKVEKWLTDTYKKGDSETIQEELYKLFPKNSIGIIAIVEIEPDSSEKVSDKESGVKYLTKVLQEAGYNVIHSLR